MNVGTHVQGTCSMLAAKGWCKNILKTGLWEAMPLYSASSAGLWDLVILPGYGASFRVLTTLTSKF